MSDARFRALAAICLAVLDLPAAEPAYRIAPGPAVLYVSETVQEIAWESAGDHLAYRQSLLYRMAWKCTGIEGDLARVDATILRVVARQSGPGLATSFDSAEPGGDPALKLLKTHEGITLHLVIDRTTGATRVTGGAAISERIAKAETNPLTPDQPSLLAVQARTLYADEPLSRLWSLVLALPAAGPDLPVAEPLTGSLNRTWKGLAYAVSGRPTGSLTLVSDPSPVTVTVNGPATGGGSVEIGTDGWPRVVSGTLAVPLAFSAFTQPGTMRLTCRFQLTREEALKTP